MAVDVNKLKCYFVHEVLKYLTCIKYSIDCCSTKAFKALWDYKLATFTECDVPFESTCYLENLNIIDYSIDCSTANSILDCDAQINLALTKLTESCLIKSVISNPSNGSQYPVITVTDDSSYPVASINLVTFSSCGDVDSHTIESGSYLVNGTPVFDETFNPHVRVSIEIPNVLGNAGGFVNYFWMYETVNATTLNPNKILVDLNPTSSPYLSCGGCTTVDPNELYFDHPNFPIALERLIKNAMLVLYGDEDLGDFKVEYFANGYRLSSLAKHNPASTWVGFAKLQSYINYYTGSVIANTSPSSGALLTEYSGFTQVVYNMPINTCSVVPITVQGLSAMAINWGLTDMHQIVLLNTNGTSPWAIASLAAAICPKTTLTATVTTAAPIATKEWRDPTDTYVSDTLSIVVEDVGEYTFRVELDNGCSLSDTITV